MAHKLWDGLNTTARQDSYHIAPNPIVGARTAHCLFIQVEAWGSRLIGTKFDSDL